MLLNSMEKTIVRRAKLLNILYCKKEDVNKLSFVLGCTPLTIVSDVKFLKQTLKIPIHEPTEGIYTLKPGKKHLEKYIHRLFKTSTFLKFLDYFFIEDAKIEFLDFIRQQKVSTAKGYRMRQEISKCLSEMGLALIDNYIYGNPLLLRVLKAELTINFGMNLIVLDEVLKEASLNLLKELEAKLNLTFTSQERLLYQLLLQQSILKTNWQKKHFTTNTQELLKANLYPACYEKLLDKHFKTYWPKSQIEYEKQYAIIAFLIINTHVFETSLPEQLAKKNQITFLKLASVKELIKEFSVVFDVDEAYLQYFNTALYIYVRDALLGIQNILNAGVISVETPYTTNYMYSKLKDVIEHWNQERFKLSDTYADTLYKCLVSIMTTKYYKNVVIISEKLVDALFLKDYIAVFSKHKLGKIEIINDETHPLPSVHRLQTLFIIDKNWPQKMLTPVENVMYVTFPLGNEQIFEILKQLLK